MVVLLTWIGIGFVAFWKTGFDDLAIIILLYDKVKSDKTGKLKASSVTFGTLLGTGSAVLASLTLALVINSLPEGLQHSITIIAGVVLIGLGLKELYHVYPKLKGLEHVDTAVNPIDTDIEKKVIKNKSLFLQAFLFYWITGIDDLIVYASLMLNLTIAFGLTLGIFIGNISCLFGAKYVVKKLDIQNATWPNVVAGLLFLVLGIATIFGWLG